MLVLTIMRTRDGCARTLRLCTPAMGMYAPAIMRTRNGYAYPRRLCAKLQIVGATQADVDRLFELMDRPGGGY